MKAKVLIGVPSSDRWSSDFGMSLVALTMNLAMNAGSLGVSFQVTKQEGSILSKSRERCADKALANGNTHLLFLDTDQTFPADVLSRLLAHKKDVVACNIATKDIPSSPTARKFSSENDAGVLVYSTKQSPPLERVWRVGTGVMLISTDVFRTVPKPWFPVTWRKVEQAYQGEDWNFCKQADGWGFHIYVDHRLSREVEHVGKFRYNHDLLDVQATIENVRKEVKNAA